jgi:hypothetical protein
MDTAVLDPSRQPAFGTARPRARRRPLLGGLLVKEGLINRVQLEKALALQQALESPQLLGQILVEQKLVTPFELHSVLQKYRKEYRLGDVLIETRVITKEQLDLALVHQRKSDLSLGEILMRLDLITESQLKRALCIQLRISFVDLDGWTLDPGLSRFVSESYARHHCVVPIAKGEDWLTLAMDDPTDFEVPDELRSSTGCRILVVAATRAAIDRALARLYGERAAPGPERRDERLPDAPATVRDEVEPIPPRPVETTGDLPAPADEARIHPAPPAAGSASGEPPAEGSALPEVAFGAIRSGIDVVRRLVTRWESSIASVEGLLRERDEQRVAIERLEGELQELRSVREALRRALDAKALALTELQAAHAALLREEEEERLALAELRDRYDALLRDRQFVTDQLDAVFRRLRPSSDGRPSRPGEPAPAPELPGAAPRG